jgi:hypothetical protein
VISRKLLWFIGLAFLGVLAMTQWAGSYPARVVIINQGQNLSDLKVTTSGETFAIGSLQSGQTRVLKVEAGDYVRVEFAGTIPRRWQSPEKLAPAQSLILNIRDERVEIQQRPAR